MEVDRSLRGVRAAVFAAACVGVSAAGHMWMSRAAVPLWALLVAVLAVGADAYILAGRQRGFASIAGLMLAGEFGLHLLFALAQPSTGGPVPSISAMPGMQGMPTMPGMVMPDPSQRSAWRYGGGLTATGTSPGHGAMASMSAMPGHGLAGMIAVHAAAGLLCAWWLRRGEAAVFRLLRALAQLAAMLLVIVRPGAQLVPDPRIPVPDGCDENPAAGRRLLLHAVVRRGPPSPLPSW
ncbi:MAG: hypothetical protein ACRDVE_20475 [Actinocrinis sp.]